MFLTWNPWPTRSFPPRGQPFIHARVPERIRHAPINQGAAVLISRDAEPQTTATTKIPASMLVSFPGLAAVGAHFVHFTHVGGP
jgi:hypothetical protein